MGMKDEYFEVLNQLEQHHALFGRFWAIGSIVENKNIPTACISFDRQSGDGVQFQINPDFWNSIDLYKKTFVIAHECLHVYLEHGRRMSGMNPRIANIAADIVVNHYLIDGFSFNRDLITDWEKYCWLDTVFKGKDVQSNQSFEHYYQLLMEMAEQNKSNDDGAGGDGVPDQETVDGHDGLGGMTQDIAEQITRKLSPSELESFKEITRTTNADENKIVESDAGSIAGALSRIIKLSKIVKKRKWEHVIKNVLGRFNAEAETTVEQWLKKSRRMAAMPSGTLLLPSEVDDVAECKDKVDVWLFQDTSGSCVDLAERFFKAAASIPEDRFRVRMFCFDTKVYETDLKSGKLYGFGGTTFSCIENYINHLVDKEKGCRYPSVVFVVTDGYGDKVNPKHPERWNWFLSENSTARYLPPSSHKYELKNFE